jgi:tetraprenyl-beta-curcumene synthase
LNVLPQARAEVGAWRRQAEQIPNNILRNVARQALLAKSDILEGALTFAVFAPPQTLSEVVRAITAFEIAFDYLDNLVEFPGSDQVRNSVNFCHVLPSMLGPGLFQSSDYKHHSDIDDGGYLEALVGTCRTAVNKLPSYATIAESAGRVLSRIATYQSLSHGDDHGSGDAFRHWANSQSTPEIDLRWWEMGAALGSQLSVLALIAAAADPTTELEQAWAIERAYFPWVGALSTLLDSVVDQHADRRDGQRCLIDYYGSPQVAAERLRLMAAEAQAAVLQLPDAANHMMILAAMAAFFHSRPQALASDVGLATRAVLDTMGGLTIPALFFFRARRTLTQIAPSNMRRSDHNTAVRTPKK